MKKRYRDITVDDKPYTWCVKSDNDDGGTKIIIYSLYPKRKLIVDTWVDNDKNPVTPKLISEIIQKINSDDLLSLKELIGRDDYEYKKLLEMNKK